MQCPFPGMDPYIEIAGLWGDFHPEMIAEIKRAIAPQLPTVPVPLLPGEAELRLDLGPLVNAIYVGSNYGRSINYALPLSPQPKDGDDTSWLAELLRSAGRIT